VAQDAAAEVPPPDAVTEGGGSPSERRCAFLELALALGPGLPPDALDLLYRAAKFALQVPPAAPVS
jgi:ribosomal RNA-processing protein 12